MRAARPCNRSFYRLENKAGYIRGVKGNHTGPVIRDVTTTILSLEQNSDKSQLSEKSPEFWSSHQNTRMSVSDLALKKFPQFYVRKIFGRMMPPCMVEIIVLMQPR